MHAQQQERTQYERRRIEGERLSGTDSEHDRGGQCRADEEGDVGHRFGQCLGVLDQRLGNGLGNQAGVGRLEERLRSAEQRLDQDDLPDPDRAEEDQRRQDRVQRASYRVGGDHDAMARQAIRPHAAEQQQRHEGEGLRPEHGAEVGGRAGALRDVQRDRHDHHAVADHAGGLTEEQVAKILVAQDAQVRLHCSLSNGRVRRDDAPRARPPQASAGGGGGAWSHGRALQSIALPQ
jgi:hypothetical protein